jgi:NADPH:quinone reductase-like Zn-dependent oxidoreductase
MRAVVITGHGGPEVIEVRDVAVPRPGPGEVLVRVGAAGCNNTDLWTREGSYGLAGDSGRPGGWLGPLDFPRVQGGDVAGTVVAGGDGETGVVGARVLVDPAIYEDSGPDARPVDVLGSERDGGFAEYVVVPADRAHRVDESPLSDVELAALPIAYGTALGMLERGSVTGDHTVLVTGASGGVGLAAVQLARARGARVVAVCSGDKAEAVRTAGAASIVDRRRGQVIADAAEAAPQGYDAVVDVVAGPLVGPGLGLLRSGGRWVVAGALDGWAVDLDVRRLYLANLSLVGSTMHTPRIFDLLVEAARRGDVRPVVAATFELAEVAEAQRQLAQRRHVGKLVVVP